MGIHRQRRTLLAAALGLTATTALAAGCGSSDGQLPLGRDPVPLTERDPASDVLAWTETTDLEPLDRPELDLRAAGFTIRDRTLRLRTMSAAPPRSTIQFFGGSIGRRCTDRQLTVALHVDADGDATVRATDVPDGEPSAVDGATADLDGRQLTATVPLLADADIDDWSVVSRASGTDPGLFAPAGAGDMLPDVIIEGAYFTRGTGTPNYPPVCGPADPPLLPRG